MPGNKATFQDAMNKAFNAAWDKQWQKAVAEYRRALAEFPNDLSVRLSLAHALEESGQMESALREYQHLAQAQPSDPTPLMRVAALQEKLRHPADAVTTYLALADMFLKAQMRDKAIEVWRRISALEPERIDVHQKLAEVYEQSAQRNLASREYLVLARLYRKSGDQSQAVNLAERALSVDQANQEARAFLEELRPTETAASEGAASSPIWQAEKEALSRLAETLLTERDTKEVFAERRRGGSRPTLSQVEIDSLIARAVDAQTHRRVADGIDAYQKLLNGGITRSEVKFNLGLLYLESMRYDDAAKLLSETLGDKDYELASHFALGQCFRAQGKMDEAVEHFLQVTKIVDLGSVEREQADDLISVYEGLAESYAAKGDRSRSESFTNALEKFLTDKGWEDKVQEVRKHLESMRAEGNQVSLAEFIDVNEPDKVLESLSLSQEYMKREKYNAASEECYRAIQLAPSYLPSHIRLAEIFAKAERPIDASVKYQTIAALCVARGELARAETLYRNALKLDVGDVVARSKLIDLMLQQGRHEDVLDQYIDLGDGMMRANQFAKAAERFSEGIRLAQRSGTRSPQEMTLRHRLAEAYVRLGDSKNALAMYQEIRQLSSDDERALFYIVDLGFRMKQPDAVKELDNLLVRYQKRGEPQKVVAVLESLGQSYPSEPAILERLAQVYAAMRNNDKAIAALDALGDVYMNLGNKRAAADAIRKIISLNTPRVEEYKHLLQQIGE